MIDLIDDGGPAFPVEYNPLGIEKPSLSVAASRGMTLHDWFAGQALMGLMARAGSENFSESLRANIAMRQADAMIAARKEQPE